MNCTFSCILLSELHDFEQLHICYNNGYQYFDEAKSPAEFAGDFQKDMFSLQFA